LFAPLPDPSYPKCVIFFVKRRRRWFVKKKDRMEKKERISPLLMTKRI
jgi:hypothetical protein